MGFVDFFIRRVVFAIVCAILIVIAGTVVIPGLPIAQYPQIALPQVVVSASYVGASSAEVESGVTMPLEQQINGVQGMKYITSSSNDGSSSITVTFDASRDIDLAAVDVQNRVNTALARLPVDVRNLGVTITKNSGAFIGAYALFTQDERYDEKLLSNYADVYMKDRLKRISGVADVLIFGERRFSMRLWLDPDRMAARNMSPTDVLTALREQNVQVAAGSVGLPPAPSGQTYQISVRAVGRLIEASQFEEVVVKSLPDGTIVRLKDVGRAELGAESYSQLSRWKGKRAVGLGILQLPGSNALDVKKKVDAAMARLAKEFPPGLVYETAFDTTAPVSASIKDVVVTLLQAILLVIATIYLFLQSLRSTLIPAITIPVSLLGTFAFVKLFGFSINTLTLFGLTLATGLVVDDAIVVIENITRVMDRQHISPREAASKGMAEVTSAVIATSLVLIAVFVPVAFFPGTTGKIYQQFSLTIAFSIGLSAFNAITLTPALSARLLRAEDHGPAARKKNLVFRGFDRGFEALRSGYTRALAVAIRFRALTALAFLGLLGATGWLFTHVPQAFIPDEDQGYFIVIVQGPEGSSLEVTSETMRGVEDTLAKMPEILGCVSVPGFSLLGAGPNKGAIFCSLIPWEERGKPGQDAMSLVARLRGPLMGVGGAFVLPFSPPAIQGVGNVGGFQFEIEDQTSEPKIENLAGATFGLIVAGNHDPSLSNVFSAFTANDPQIVVEVDRDRAKALGISLDEVFSTLQIYMGSAYVNDFVFGTRTYRVYIQADRQYRARPADLTSLYARSSAGQMVSLAELVKVTNTATAQSINHYNLFRSTEIQGSPGPGVSTGQALLAMERAAREQLPPGFSFEWSGLSLEQLESGGQTLYIFGLGIVFVFLVLAAQYESFVLPFIIILSVPGAMLGALLLQMLRGYSNDVFCQVGLVMLIGMSSKNAILIVEFARELRQTGKSVIEAALEAAETRLRPILMTSMAFLLGVTPLLVATGAGSVGRRSLGTTVFGGMLLSTVLNLFFIPVLYILVETLRERVGGVDSAVHAPAVGGEAE
ncbi:MAG TPA: multidrug efflux RND transporter permease subunit [Polyangiaceae bacterium]|nr:multidrug efflux RND transporter permease subunit [Polyangiaceae bacterium]